MKGQKSEALVEVDGRLGPDIAVARAELTEELDADRRTAIHDRLEELTPTYFEIERMPTWPVDRALYRRVTLGNLALIVPLIAQLAAAATKWEKL
jgi:hypothetical protein